MHLVRCLNILGVQISLLILMCIKILSDRQHDFRKRHRCGTQMTTVVNNWAKTLDNKGQMDTFI